MIDGDTTLDVGGVRVDLLHVGPAHTEGDLVVHLPDEGVVLMGDVLFSRCTPIGWEGSTDRWIQALQRVEALAPEHVIPGHGPVGGVDDVRSARVYLQDVQAHAADCWAAGTSVIDCCRWHGPRPVCRVGRAVEAGCHVHRVYRECAGADWDTPFDAAAVMRDVRAAAAPLGGLSGSESPGNYGALTASGSVGATGTGRRSPCWTPARARGNRP